LFIYRKISEQQQKTASLKNNNYKVTIAIIAPKASQNNIIATIADNTIPFR